MDVLKYIFITGCYCNEGRYKLYCRDRRTSTNDDSSGNEDKCNQLWMTLSWQREWHREGVPFRVLVETIQEGEWVRVKHKGVPLCVLVVSIQEGVWVRVEREEEWEYVLGS